MLPRKSSLQRLVMVVGAVVVGGWLWISPPIDTPSDVLPNFIPSLHSYARNNTPARASRDHIDANPFLLGDDDKQSHHHSNQSLENLRKNMTLLKANMSGVESLIVKVNRSNAGEGSNSRQQNNHINLANPHPFDYIINTQTVCQDKDLFLIAYIHTAPSHYKRRMIIRQTWGNPSFYDMKVRLIFVMGKTNDKPEIQQALMFESEQYGDIVQEDFQDSYKNLTYKGVAALKWISNYCSHAKFVLKTDDDIFVNMFTLLRHLVSLDKLNIDNKGLLMCLVWYRMKVMREGKWKISEEEWKDSYYPTYCSGSAFTMSTDVAIAMHNVSYHVPFFWVDDFYITGLLPLKLGEGKVRHKQFMSTYVLDGRKLHEKFTGPQWYSYIFSHVHDLNAIQSVWTRLVGLAKGKVALQPIKYALPGELHAKEKEQEEKEKKEAEEIKKKAEEANKSKKEEEDKKKKAEEANKSKKEEEDKKKKVEEANKSKKEEEDKKKKAEEANKSKKEEEDKKKKVEEANKSKKEEEDKKKSSKNVEENTQKKEEEKKKAEEAQQKNENEEKDKLKKADISKKEEMPVDQKKEEAKQEKQIEAEGKP